MALLKSVLFWIAFIVLLFVGSIPGAMLPPSPGISKMLYGIFGTLSAFLLTWVFLKMEKGTFRRIGLVWERQTLVRFGKGLLIGAGIFGGMTLVLVVAAGLQWESGQTPAGGALLACLVFIPLALMEEVAFRAYPLLKLNDAVGLRATQVIVALAFALYHVANGWSVYVAFSGPFVWAFVFGLAAVRSGGIALPTGIHVALNVGQQLVGFKASGPSLWKLNAPDGLTKDMIARTDRVGFLLQLTVFIIAIVATEMYIRRDRSRPAAGQPVEG